MAQINPIESKILTYLLKRKTYTTTRQVAKGSRISWNTAEDYLGEFYKKGWIEVRIAGRRKYWRIRR